MTQAGFSYNVLIVTLIVIGVVLVGLVVSIGLGHFGRNYKAVRREARMATLRPQMLNLVSEGEIDHAELDLLVGENSKLAEEIAWQLLPKVRGSVRDSLVNWLKSGGAVAREDAATRSRWAVNRLRAAERLGRTGLVDHDERLLALLHDHKHEVRVVAARALGKLGNPNAVPALLDSLEGKKALPATLVAMAILHIGPGVTEHLLRGMSRRSFRARLVCAELLGLLGDPKAVRPLSHVTLNDVNTEVRARAAKSLGRLSSPGSVETLMRSTAPNQPQVLRIAAVRALGQIGGRDALATLHACAQNTTAELSIASMQSLSELGEEGRSALVLLASGSDVFALRARDWLARLDLRQQQIQLSRAARRRSRAQRSRSLVPRGAVQQ